MHRHRTRRARLRSHYAILQLRPPPLRRALPLAAAPQRGPRTRRSTLRRTPPSCGTGRLRTHSPHPAGLAAQRKLPPPRCRALPSASAYFRAPGGPHGPLRARRRRRAPAKPPPQSPPTLSASLRARIGAAYHPPAPSGAGANARISPCAPARPFPPCFRPARTARCGSHRAPPERAMPPARSDWRPRRSRPPVSRPHRYAGAPLCELAKPRPQPCWNLP
mmetsp:Transcript_81247/g.226183  ORF Transcript_81247/g.226183 Transcript_81247/m.226183 type:complete len:220 (-) Transcript_81247:745-1404(-)